MKVSILGFLRYITAVTFFFATIAFISYKPNLSCVFAFVDELVLETGAIAADNN